jgi:hydroxymethylglutaryl-CoA lyase
MAQLPARVTVYEVGPRDGLQNEARVVPVDEKLALINALADAGIRRIEATSFVSPKWIPQLADAEQVASGLPAREGLVYSALVPNVRGLERVSAHPSIQTVAVFMSSSETHNKRNVNRTIAESLRGLEEVIPKARQQGLGVRAYVSTVWGCPYEGAIDPKRALEICLALYRLGATQISLGDTIGVGTPGQTARICELFLKSLPAEAIALHLHDTRGTALANAVIGLQAGITTFDSSIGGMGGCPYAPGASGNLATEDLVYMLQGMEIETGIDMDRLVDAGRLAERVAGHPLPGRYLKAAVAERRQKEIKAARAQLQEGSP